MVTIDSRLKDIMNCPEAVAVLEKILPGCSTNPLLRLGYPMPLRKICEIPQAGVTPEQAKQIEEALAALSK